ncbi:hypothetical protein FRC07_004186 [Ceratobasidium sp. 392]|nr:hypothetical protein FRC07_004186 [Ceratobasidium sp. 392]
MGVLRPRDIMTSEGLDRFNTRDRREVENDESVVVDENKVDMVFVGSIGLELAAGASEVQEESPRAMK